MLLQTPASPNLAVRHGARRIQFSNTNTSLHVRKACIHNTSHWCKPSSPPSISILWDSKENPHYCDSTRQASQMGPDLGQHKHATLGLSLCLPASPVLDDSAIRAETPCLINTVTIPAQSSNAWCKQPMSNPQKPMLPLRNPVQFILS